MTKQNKSVILGKSPDDKLTPAEAGEYLGRSPETLLSWRNEGHGPVYVREGRHDGTGRVYYLVRDLVEWVEKNRVDPRTRKHPGAQEQAS